MKAATILLGLGFVALLAAVGIATPLSGQTQQADLSTRFISDARPLFKQYCFRCHSGKEPEGEIDFEQISNLADAKRAVKVWQKSLEMLESRQMPPKDSKQPSTDDHAKLSAWIRDFLKAEAKALAGDPGRVVLRRLSNAEYTYTLRDLTGVDSLEPAKEFPVDGAAGEGFTNAGDALSMSPALLSKYLDAAKRIGKHLVLLPDGIRFSRHTTQQDWTNEILDQIRSIYSKYSDSESSTKVALQGLVWDTKQGGRLPVEKYLAATLRDREALRSGKKSIASVAQEAGLSARYLETLWQSLNSDTASLLLDSVRARWKEATPADADAMAAEISRWQNAMWKFSSVGHIGKVGGPKAWMEPLDPVLARQELKLKIPAEREDIRLVLSASDLGDGNQHDVVVWESPRFVAPGKAPILLKDVQRLTGDLYALRDELFADADKVLAGLEELAGASDTVDIVALAKKHAVEPEVFRVWADAVGLGSGPATITGHMKSKLPDNPTYKFIQGWGVPDTPVFVANSSKEAVRIPGKMKPHSVGVHPSPKLNALVGWQSPVSGKLRLEAQVAHAHPECGDGVSWAIELRRGATRNRLAAGVAQGTAEPKIAPLDLNIQKGDVIALVIGPRSNHSCDMTATDLTLRVGDAVWNLAKDVSPNILASNPHADGLGNPAVWHFFTEPVANTGEQAFAIPSGSTLDRWRSATAQDQKRDSARELQKLLTAKTSASKDSPDAVLVRRFSALNGPLLGRLRGTAPRKSPSTSSPWGLDPARFGVHPSGSKVPSDCLCVQAPSVVEFRVPADLVAGYELVTTGTIHPDSREQGSVQLQLHAQPGKAQPALLPGLPIVVAEGGAARARIATSVEAFRSLFPPAVSYTKIVPVDEVVTLTLFHREDHLLANLMLEEPERRRLEKLWEELHYVSHSATKQVDAYNQLMEYATQDSDPRPFEPLRKPFLAKAAAFRQHLIDTQPKHLDAVISWAQLAFRRPMTEKERHDLRDLYQKLRKQDLSHEDALRMTLARVLVSPTFLYRLESAPQGAATGPVNDWELATRLSYFLTSSAPDAELRREAQAGQLREPKHLVAQTRRLLKDAHVRRLAIEFACQWLHIRGFDESSEKSERHFPTFAQMRGPMYEESIQFFTDFFQRDRSVLEILDADHTFLNEALAKHYDVPNVQGEQWRRVDGVRRFGRGGILGQATTLASQSGASRTSPILRGNWISEVLLGEKLPRPPKGVPQLPDDESKTEGLTVRQLIERHSSDAKCVICHQRIDAYGFALEGYDAIGRKRDKDLGNRAIDTRAKAMDGAEFEGLEGVRKYLLTTRRDAFVRQFCRKLLGYALGRGVQLSDEPLLDSMQDQLKAQNFRVSAAIEAIVRSPQFLQIRGQAFAER